MIDYTDTLTSRLNANRPDRYIDKTWIDQVADSIPIDVNHMEEIARAHLRHQARALESNFTKSANSVMREYRRTGQEPLDWQLVGEIPISVKNTILVDGKPKTVRERVKLAAATPRDLELWAEEERRASDREHKSRMLSVEAAEIWAAKIRESGQLSWGAYQQSLKHAA
ncbi:hypothetical protein COJE103337_04055 [Corynebacterium jeikeium]|uniref:hypothetical protein n=1 Tax=Corynebacterium jeikeium TaxID=38289 RepID=UPI0001B7157C|nr:hypothetical protein [Corynebacterium jeikeium]EEW17424.1 hypothetical protein HMPREF0297_0301 [Corynebacterium jeikeium ATCC 43734]OOD32506.1 hypothetical protein BWP03_03940 [Corynebacterium jeikeium]WCZ54169.1 hypothetical protein CJEIK_08370 [Corynebacterium jeikeium]SUY80525.1 Uncharacterised protein [Corynebacterium jeikeium]